MDAAFYLTTLGVIPVFAFRAFVPLFATALVARVGPELAPFAELAGIQLLAGLPAWVTDDVTLVILGGMALFEMILAKVPETRAVLDYTGTQLKAIAAFLTCFYLVHGDPSELLDHLRKEGLSTDYAWGQSFAYTWSFGIGACVWLLATLRQGVYGLLRELDEDDSVGLQRLVSWIEDGVGFVGVVFAVVTPVLALAVAGATVVLLYGLRRWLEARQERQRTPCPACGVEHHLCGVRCGACGAAMEGPRRVGWLGGARVEPAVDLDAHRLRLLASKRCPVCADRLPARRLGQQCATCGTKAFPDRRSFDRYLASLQGRLPQTLAVCFGFGLVPLLGLAPGIIYYRLNLISGLRPYIPAVTGVFTRWLARFANLVLVILQPIPLLGALTLPAMCWVNYTVYRRALLRQV